MKKTLLLCTMLSFVLVLNAWAQRTVSGTVTDDNGEGLPGVTVLIKGTTTGTTTDINGQFQLAVPDDESILVFRYVGFDTQEIAVGNRTVIDVTMGGATELEELVVTAIGVVRKPDEITTANQVVKSEDLNQASNPDAVQALSGKVSGLQINTTSAGLTPNTQITLRGNRSISGNNSALVVIDNIVSTAEVLSTLDPNIIESINVIKGANGAALYGELGAAGVLIVTTKKGSKNGEKFSVSISSSMTMEKVAYLPETQDRFGQGWGGNIEPVDQGSWGVPYNGAIISIGTPDADGEFRNFPYSHIEDNILPFFNTGYNYQNSVSLSGGSMETGFVNLSYRRQDINGIIPGSNLKKDNFSLTTGKKINKLTVQTIVRYTEEKTDDVDDRDVDNKLANNQYPRISMYQRLVNTPGNVPIQAFSSGDNNDHWTIYETSPYWTLQNDRKLGGRRISDLTGELGYEFTENISAIIRSSVRNIQTDIEINRNGFIDDQFYVGGDRSIRSFYQQDQANERRTYTDFMINFDYDLTSDLTFKSNVGLNNRSYSYSRQVNGGFDLAIPGFFNLSNITSIPDYFENNLESRAVSIFGQIDLGYKDFVYLNITGRNDWNSVLPEANRSFFYPSIGASFIPTRAFNGLESKILRKAKISASYVKTGNATALQPQQLPIVAIQDTFYPSTGLVSLVGNTSVVDQNVSPEFINSFETNLNLELLDIDGPRITLDVSAMSSKNIDQILNISSSSATGYQNTLKNLGETKSKSLEIDLGFTPIRRNGFEVNGVIGFSTFQTTVVKVTDDSDRVQVSGSNGQTIGAYAVEGQQFPLLLGTAYERDDQGRVVVDSDGNPLINPDLQVLGKVTPDYILNFVINAKYKGFRVGAVADYRTGHVFYSGIKNQLSGQGRTIETTYNDRIPFVFPNSTVEGTGTDNTDVITYGWGDPDIHPYNNAYGYYTGAHNDIDENFIVDATAFKIREVSVSYEFPTTMTEKMRLSRLNIGVSGRNLWTKLPKNNLDYNDPEFAGRYGIGGYGITPPTRYFAFTVNASF